MMRRLFTFVCNFLWFLSCLPGWVLFLVALHHPRRVQERVLRRLLRRNRDVDVGRLYGFASIRTPEDFALRVPLAEYGDIVNGIAAARRGEPFPLAAEKVLLLEPTSGSSGTPKLIPCTGSLLQEFGAAIKPWIAWLYLAHPRLLCGRQYWVVSPNTRLPDAMSSCATSVPVGFLDDSEYLGVAGRFFSRGILAAPPELRHVTDRDLFVRFTLLFLLREKSLRLVSVWHPSFLTLLLEALPRHIPAILGALRSGRLDEEGLLAPYIRAILQAEFRADPGRAKDLETLDIAVHPRRLARAWPRLEVISCWSGARSEPYLATLRALFPGVTIQGKGLLATEGVVTLPSGCGTLYPCAIRSHYLEFCDSDTGDIFPVWKLKDGHEYSVVVTTGGGLWRYRLHDRVRVDGFCHATPCLKFLGKDNAVSDLVGEKLDEHHVAEAIVAAESATGIHPVFTMIVPVVPEGGCAAGTCGYLLLLELSADPSTGDAVGAQLATAIDHELCNNYHYAHARNLGQLHPLRPVFVHDGLAAYCAMRESRGARAGTVKIPALAPGNTGCWW